MTKFQCRMTNQCGSTSDEGRPRRDFIIRHLKIPSSFACHAEALAKAGHSDFVIATTTLSHRSHKSGCALLFPTVGRWRQQRAHFLYGVFVTEELASFAC